MCPLSDHGGAGPGGPWAEGLRSGAQMSGSHGAACPAVLSVWVTFPAADRGQVPAAQPCPTPTAPPASHIPPLFREDTWELVALQGAASTLEIPNPPLPSLCPRLCQLLPAALPRACGISVRISLSFLPRIEQLIIYPIIKEETVNEMKTSQKHLLGLLSSPPRAACAGSGGGRGWGRRGGHGSRRLSLCSRESPALHATAPSSSGTPGPGTLSPLHHQTLAQSCQAGSGHQERCGSCHGGVTLKRAVEPVGLVLPSVPRDVPGC